MIRHLLQEGHARAERRNHELQKLLVTLVKCDLALLQGLAGNLSIAHEHTVHCSCQSEVTWQDLIQLCQQKPEMKCNYWGY